MYDIFCCTMLFWTPLTFTVGTKQFEHSSKYLLAEEWKSGLE